MNRHEQITLLHELSRKHEVLTGKPSFMHSAQRSPSHTEWFVFSDGRTIPEVSVAIAYARAMLQRAEGDESNGGVPVG